MASHYNDVMNSMGSSVQEDAAIEVMAGWIDKSLLKGVQDELTNNYQLKLEFQEISDIMEEEGIDFGYYSEYSVADLIWESLQED
jgi:hypothetical protein